MKKTKGTNASIFELNGIPQLSKALPLALQHDGGYDRWSVTPAYYCGRSGRTRGYKPCHADSVGTGSFCTFHIFTAVPNRI